MTAIAAIAATAPAAPAAPSFDRPVNVLPTAAPGGDFASVLSQGIANMDAKVAEADRMVTRFALDDNVPVHQVTIALEEARLAVEFTVQVRQRLVEGYKELMNMQL